MSDSFLHRILLGVGIISVLFGAWYFLNTTTSLVNIETDLAGYNELGNRIATDFNAYPLLTFSDDYKVTDTLKDGIDITYTATTSSTLTTADETQTLALQFPSNLREPITITLTGGRTITMVHQDKTDAKAELLTNVKAEVTEGFSNPDLLLDESIADRTSAVDRDPAKAYLKYTSDDKRINTYYAYQKDQANGYRNLKHWTVFNQGDGEESQSYRFANAHLKVNDRGEVEVRYVEPPDESVRAQVGDDVWARAQAVLAEDLEDVAEHTEPDFIIPAPYTIDANGNQVVHEWSVLKSSTLDPKDTSGDYVLQVSFTVPILGYPIALDPTLQFTAPGYSEAGEVITGETTSNYFGASLQTGDFNADGKDDLAVGAYGHTSFTGRTYIFYGGSMTSENASGADVILTGETTPNYFGASLQTGDFNADGKDDLVVGAYGHTSFTGRAYIFYGGSMISENASGADVILTGETTSNYFGASLQTGDFNADGKDDLVVGAWGYSASTGRAYIFYGGSMTSENASGADVTLTGETTFNRFGYSLQTGDFNADGKDDLAVGAYGYNSTQGRTYLFYGGSMTSENASGADVTLTGETTSNSFGVSLASADLNADGKDDLAVGASSYSTGTGRAYIFYGGSMISENASGADVTLTGETTSNYFGYSLQTGDFNADGKDDLAVGASGYSSNTGRTYIFYGGSMTSENASGADVTLTGETTSNSFGVSLASADLNADGKDDLAVGAYAYSSNTGRAYIFYSQSGQVNLDTHITGEAAGNYFGYSLQTGDFNADGKDDLAVGASSYSTGTGRAYIFYGGSMISENASGADVTLTGETTSNYFGYSLQTGDFNADGKDDLAVGAYGYNSTQGRTYLFYGGSMVSENASGADVTLTGETTSNSFGVSLQTGDFNADGKDDLAVGAWGYSTFTGRAYIFYGGSMISENASGADVTLTGEATFSFLGVSLQTGDFNADGKDDLAVGASVYSSSIGRAYIFYGGSIITENASGADVILTGEATSNRFGAALQTGDFNADGKDDLAVGAWGYNSDQGRTYIFYGGSMTSENASGADVILTGEATSNRFGAALQTGDFNADGKDDLAVGAQQYSSNTGRVYIFYGGSVVSENATGADVILTGDVANDDYGTSLATYDYNHDGRDDLVVGAPGYNNGGDTGRIYFYETRENYVWETQRQSLVDDVRVHPIMGHEMKITGESGSGQFGTSMTVGDFNADGKDDLAVGANEFNSGQGRVYIFYNDGNYETKASRADVVITGEATSNQFGSVLQTGDFNADGKDDLAVGAQQYSSNTGRVYIFYGGSIVTENAVSANVILTGGATSNYFGNTLQTGDFNADGKDDLAVGAWGYSASTGRTYLFYGGSMISESASGADVTLTGGGTNNAMGAALQTGDFNADGKDDLAVGAWGYSTLTGRAYIFYGGSMISENASGADITLTGAAIINFFGYALQTGDFNADGKDDLAVGAYGYNSNQGRTYLFYGGSMISESATGADVALTGDGTSSGFGDSLQTGDFNHDGKDDLVVGTAGYNSNQGRAYIFYGGSMTSENASGADVIMTGETTSNLFGKSIITGDFNADGKDDLAVGAWGVNSNQGRVYFYTTNDFQISGVTANEGIGTTLTTGDFNADGKLDLAVGAPVYSSNLGRLYIFYGGDNLSETVATADYTITGESGVASFGSAVAVGDLNSDGVDDLLVGAYDQGPDGKAYIFYGGGSFPSAAASADVAITGETLGQNFGFSLVVADVDNDGDDDVVISDPNYGTFSTGKIYFYYNDGAYPSVAGSADANILGTDYAYIGSQLTVADLDDDADADLISGSTAFNGGAYIFYNSSGFATLSSSADATFNSSIVSDIKTADFNGDNYPDFVISSGFDKIASVYYGSEAFSGAVTADVTITGSALNFANGIQTGDFNADGKDDLIITDTVNSESLVIYSSHIASGAVEDFADLVIPVAGTLLTADIDDNGTDDILIGDTEYDVSSNEGRVYVIMSEIAAKRYSSHRIQGSMKIEGTGSFH